MFLRRRLDVCAQSETKLNERGDVMFGEVVDSVGRGGREGEGMGGPITELVVAEVCSRMEGGVIQAYMG